MPLTDLIRFFNSTDAAGDSTLYPEGERAAAWHDGLHLRSLFQPIVDLGSNRVVSHQAFLAATREDGTPLPAGEAYERCRSGETIVHFDRLCRTLHALNFLAQRRHAGGYLQLAVHPRHLLAVTGQHGLVFEAVLKRCGLAPDDIVLELATGQIVDDAHLADAVRNYRQRGYRIALAGLGPPPELFAADIVKQPLASLRGLPRSDARFHADQLAGDGELAEAAALGIALAQGPLFGLAQADCVSTHSPRGVAYNPPD